jgi:hypothetical protein
VGKTGAGKISERIGGECRGTEDCGMSEFLFFLWLADVVDRLGGLVFMSFFAAAVYCVFAWVAVSDCDLSAEKAVSIGRKLVCFVCVLGLLAFIAPSKQTIYIAAAGSATNTALQTETGKKLVQAFNKKVDEYLKDGEK